MSYTPINWQNGDTITAEKMNKMDNGWGVSSTQLFSETVTTSIDPEFPEDPALGQLSYSQFIDADTIVVTFNGDEYVCPKVDLDWGNGYGGWRSDGPDLSDIPFAIGSSEHENVIFTENAGTYTIAVSAVAVAVSDDFSDAVNKAVVIPDVSTMPFRCVDGQTEYNDMQEAFDSERPLYFYADSMCFYITDVAINAIRFFPQSQNVSASFVNNIFTVTLT